MTRRARVRWAGAWATLACASAAPACKPDLDQRTDLVTAPRVLAVRAEPAEVAPGGTVTLSALYVDARGEMAQGALDWAFCEDRKALAELGPVSARCALRAGDFFLELGGAPQIAAAVPADACRQFGPDVPVPLPGQPPGRPVDPDSTGGFYQPVRFATPDQTAIGRVRVTCTVSGATPEQLGQLQQRNHANVDPQIDALADATLGSFAFAGDGVTAVAASQRLALRASWADCDPAAPACTGAEGYAAYDVTTHQVQGRREQLRISWFATGGSFDEDRTGRDEGDETPFTENGWTAPAALGAVHLWVVVRDDRGGVGWRSYDVDVR